MSFTNMLLGGGWGLGEWPDHIEVVHDNCRRESRTYVPERTCRMVLDEEMTRLLEYDEVFRYTACGEEVVRKTGTTIRFCPMCRARVTDWVVPG